MPLPLPPPGGHRLHRLQRGPPEQLLPPLHQPLPAQRVPEGAGGRGGDLPGLRQVSGGPGAVAGRVNGSRGEPAAVGRRSPRGHLGLLSRPCPVPRESPGPWAERGFPSRSPRQPSPEDPQLPSVHPPERGWGPSEHRLCRGNCTSAAAGLAPSHTPAASQAPATAERALPVRWRGEPEEALAGSLTPFPVQRSLQALPTSEPRQPASQARGSLCSSLALGWG